MPDTITRNGISWIAVLKLVGWATPFIIGAAMLYLGSEFVTHGQLQAATHPLRELPVQLQSLQEFKARQERAQERTEQKFEVVQRSLATIEAQQAATDKKLDRVLDTLERMEK